MILSGCFCLNEVAVVDVNIVTDHFEESCEAMKFSYLFHGGPPEVINDYCDARYSLPCLLVTNLAALCCIF